MLKHGIIFLLIFSFLQFTGYCQPNIPGNYQSNKHFTYVSLILDRDSTFSYFSKWHMGGDRSNGYYLTRGDSIFFKFRQFKMDTVSIDGKPVIIDQEAMFAINRPDTLVYKKNKLFRIENGRIINKTKRQQVNFIRTKGWKKWYRKKYYLFGPYISRKRNIYYVQKTN